MDLPKGSTWKTLDELNRYLVNTCPGMNHNLIIYALVLQTTGASLKDVLKKTEVTGSPFLKIADRDL